MVFRRIFHSDIYSHQILCCEVRRQKRRLWTHRTILFIRPEQGVVSGPAVCPGFWETGLSWDLWERRQVSIPGESALCPHSSHLKGQREAGEAGWALLQSWVPGSDGRVGFSSLESRKCGEGSRVYRAPTHARHCARQFISRLDELKIYWAVCFFNAHFLVRKLECQSDLPQIL